MEATNDCVLAVLLVEGRGTAGGFTCVVDFKVKPWWFIKDQLLSANLSKIAVLSAVCVICGVWINLIELGYLEDTSLLVTVYRKGFYTW